MPFLKIKHAGTGTRDMPSKLVSYSLGLRLVLILCSADCYVFHRLRTSLEKVAGLANTTVTDFRKKNYSKWIIQVDNPPMNVKLMRAKRARWTRFDFNWIDCEILFIQKLKKFWILDYGNLKKSDFWKFYRTLY